MSRCLCGTRLGFATGLRSRPVSFILSCSTSASKRSTSRPLDMKTKMPVGRSVGESSSMNIRPKTAYRFSHLAKDRPLSVQAKGYVEALGGADNIVEVEACTTRLRLNLKDVNKLNEAQSVKGAWCQWCHQAESAQRAGRRGYHCRYACRRNEAAHVV